MTDYYTPLADDVLILFNIVLVKQQFALISIYCRHAMLAADT